MNLHKVLRRKVTVLGGWAWGVLSSHSAGATPGAPIGEEETASYHLVYSAPAECLQRRDFLDQISRRIRDSWLARSEQPAGTLSVTINKVSEHYWAHMTVASRWGHVAFREFDSESCEEVLGDLVIAAVAAIETRIGPQPPHVELGVSAGPDWSTSHLSWGAAGLIGLRWPSSRSSVYLLVGYWASSMQEASDDAANIRFRLLSARVEICPFAMSLGSSLSIPLCGSVLGGFLRIDGDFTSSQLPSMFWASLGVSPKLRWNLDSFFVQLDPRADFILTRRVLTVTRSVSGGGPPANDEIHRFPYIGLAAEATFGWHF